MCSSLVTATMYNLLKADATLQGLIGNPVRLREFLPQENGPIVTVTPYVMYNFASQQDDTKSDDNKEDLTLTFDVFDRTSGSFINIQAIVSQIRNLLEWQGSQISDGTVAVSVCRFLDYNQTRDNDGLTLHGIMRFQILATSLQ